MAKQKGATKISGELDGKIYRKGAYGDIVQQKARLTADQKKSAADSTQAKRIPVLNSLGSPLRNALKYYAGILVKGNFWSEMLKLFHTEASNHRVLLLQKLKGMEVNTKYQFVHRCPLPETEVVIKKSIYTVQADISKPAYHSGDYNCYSLQFIFIVWKEGSNECRHFEESTEIISMQDKSPKYVTMDFKRTAADTEYLLACRLELGLNGGAASSFTDTSMRILELGAVSGVSKKILEERVAAAEAARDSVKPVPVVKEKKKLVVRGKR